VPEVSVVADAPVHVLALVPVAAEQAAVKKIPIQTLKE
jgi:hypothetical protein